MRRILSIVSVVLGAVGTLAAATHEVQVRDSSFTPRNLTIQAGDSVTWTNVGGLQHNVRADDSSFRCANGCDGQGGSGVPSSANWSFTLTFNDPDTIPYHCQLHGAPGGIGMAGTITVEGEPDPNEPDPNEPDPNEPDPNEPDPNEPDPNEPDPNEPLPGDAHVVSVPIAGSVQSASAFFRTFLRIFNPSDTEMIMVGGAFLPAGFNNANAPEIVIHLAPRESKVFEDVVGTIFDATGLGAIRFHSDDPFRVTSRIFTDSSCADPPGGIFGQFVPGVEETSALMEGAVLHLTFNEDFRANFGFYNPNLSPVVVTVTLHGSSGVIAGPKNLASIPARSALGPTSLASTPMFGLSSIDDANLWLEFSSPMPIHAYGSVVDEITQDQIFIHAVSF